MTSDGPAPAHSTAIDVPSADVTVDIDVCSAPATAADARDNMNTAVARIATPAWSMTARQCNATADLAVPLHIVEQGCL